jgi:hypothetical protein
LVAAAHCHSALTGSLSSLRPFTHLQHHEPPAQAGQAHLSLCASTWRILWSAPVDICPSRFYLPYDTWQEWGLANAHIIPVDAENIAQPALAAPATLLHARRQSNEDKLVHAVENPAHRARMPSLKCRPSGAFLDTVPVAPYTGWIFKSIIPPKKIHLRTPYSWSHYGAKRSYPKTMEQKWSTMEFQVCTRYGANMHTQSPNMDSI